MPSFHTTDGTRLRYEVIGTTGPVVYVCQGGPNNICDTLIADLAPLAEHATLVFHDYRGSGHSDLAEPSTYRFDQLAADLDELRAHLGHGRITVLAHSMGGLVALYYGLQRPDRCRQLVLVATTPAATSTAMAWPTLRALGPARTLRALGLIVWFLIRWSWPPASPEREEAKFAAMSVTQEPRRELRDLVANAHPGLPVDNDNADHLMAAMSNIDLRDQLPEIDCPVLVLYGTRDAVMVAGGQHLTNHLPNAHTVVLDDVGHEPFIEEPNRTFDELRRFLTTEPTPTARPPR